MMKKLTLSLIVMTSLMLMMIGGVSAATITVPGNYSTIQEAIDNANPGDIINVAAGTYNENIVIGKSLTVRGANAGIAATETRGSESIINAQGVPIAVLINGADTVATFDGFTVDNYDTIGILAGAFRDILQDVPLGDDPIEVHILNNIVMPPTIVPPHNNNIQVGGGTTGTIIGNDVSGALLESPDWTGSGIIVASSNNVEVSNNHVHNSEAGIVILGYAEYEGRPAAIDNVIENNLVENCEAGISVQANSIGTIIRYNDVLNNDIGIESMAYDLNWPEHSTPSGTEIHYNNIAGNTDYGVQSVVYWHDTGNVLAEQVDATENWWGDGSGPYHTTTNPSGTGDVVSDNVDYDLWCLNNECTTTNVGGEGQDFIALTVPDSINYGALYSTPEFETTAQAITLTNVGSLPVVVTPIWDSGADVFKRIKFSDVEAGEYNKITDGVGLEADYTTTITAILTSNNPLTFENAVLVWTKIKIAIGDTLAALKGPQSGTIYFQAVEA